MTELQQQARIDNIRAAESGNKQYLRRVRIRDYLAGQAIYTLGDYPAKITAKPTAYDRALIKQMADAGVQLIQLHEDWNDACRLYGADKFNAVDEEGMKEFVALCHEHGIKVIAYVSTGYFQETDPDFREEFTATSRAFANLYFRYRKGNHGNALWRAYVIPKTLEAMDRYGFDGIYNDWGYDGYVPGSHCHMDPGFYDADVEDMLSQIYSEIKRRGGIYKLHCDRNNPAPCKDRVYDYLWVGEAIVKQQPGVGKEYPGYVVPCQDRHYHDGNTLEDYFAYTIPFLQFPLMKTGRPLQGKNLDLPNVTYYGGDEQEFYAAVRKYMDAHPQGPYVYSLWSSIPDDPTEFDTWCRYFALYAPMVTENSLAYIELRSCDAIRSPLPESVYASMFVNEETYLAVSNLTEDVYTLELEGLWRDRLTGEVGSSFPIAHEKLRFLIKL